MTCDGLDTFLAGKDLGKIMEVSKNRGQMFLINTSSYGYLMIYLYLFRSDVGFGSSPARG